MTATPGLYVVVQAGGRGSRLRHHTWNKPKCLVSIRGKPILYHAFAAFPGAKFVVVGDYAYDQLERYLSINPPGVPCELLRAVGKGTAAGLAEAVALVPPDAPLLLMWSDLIVTALPALPDTDKPVVCTTDAFLCRWTASADGRLQEVPAAVRGIPGVFYFPRAALLPAPPPGGEFVRWFARAIPDFDLLNCPGLEELGDFAAVEHSNERAGFCRFFNHVEINDDTVVKTVVDDAYQEVHRNEVRWYHEAARLGFKRIPKVHSENPLVMERIRGQHAFAMTDLTERERRAVLADYLDSMIALHGLAEAPAVPEDIREVYLQKTVQRVASVAAIIPAFDKDAITINGKKCRNLFAARHAGILQSMLPHLCPRAFVPIHGDATFSNTIIDDKLRVWFIDPRGYFARPGIMGDAWYDFAKLYYSAVGGYDAFNHKKFKLHVDSETVEILMEKSAFADTAPGIFREYFGDDVGRIEIIHGLIWLALSGYAKDDIDSVIGSFYLGLYWLEQGGLKL